MRLADAMAEIVAELGTISGLRVYDYAPEQLQVPCAIVAYPEQVTYDASYQRGMDRVSVPVVVVTGKVVDRLARNAIIGYADGSGAGSIKQVLDGGAYTAFDEITVQVADFETFTMNRVDYISATFTCELAGSGE